METVIAPSNNVIYLRKSAPPAFNTMSDYSLERLVALTNKTNLVALDKSLAAIRCTDSCCAAAAAILGGISSRIWRAVHEVGMTLPEEMRAK